MHIIRIGDPCVTTNGIYVRMTLKILRNLIKCTEFDCIIGVEIVINIAGRVSEALVQTVGRSLIWFVYAMTYAIAVAVDDRAAVVRRSEERRVGEGCGGKGRYRWA